MAPRASPWQQSPAVMSVCACLCAVSCVQAGKRKGVSAELLSTNMNQVDVLIPGLVNLHKAKASDWVRQCVSTRACHEVRQDAGSEACLPRTFQHSQCYTSRAPKAICHILQYLPRAAELCCFGLCVCVCVCVTCRS